MDDKRHDSTLIKYLYTQFGSKGLHNCLNHYRTKHEELTFSCQRAFPDKLHVWSRVNDVYDRLICSPTGTSFEASLLKKAFC